MRGDLKLNWYFLDTTSTLSKSDSIFFSKVVCPSIPPSRAQEPDRQALDPASQVSEPASQSPVRLDLKPAWLALIGRGQMTLTKGI